MEVYVNYVFDDRRTHRGGREIRKYSGTSSNIKAKQRRTGSNIKQESPGIPNYTAISSIGVAYTPPCTIPYRRL